MTRPIFTIMTMAARTKSFHCWNSSRHVKFPLSVFTRNLPAHLFLLFFFFCPRASGSCSCFVSWSFFIFLFILLHTGHFYYHVAYLKFPFSSRLFKLKKVKIKLPIFTKPPPKSSVYRSLSLSPSQNKHDLLFHYEGNNNNNCCCYYYY